MEIKLAIQAGLPGAYLAAVEFGPEFSPGIVHQRIGIGLEGDLVAGIKQQPMILHRLLDHPYQGNIRQAVLGIASAHVGVHTAKPQLLDLLRFFLDAVAGLFGGGFPEHRVEGLALVVDRHGVIGAFDALAEEQVVKAVVEEGQPIHDQGDRTDGDAQRRDRIPHRQTVNFGPHGVMAFLGELGGALLFLFG